MKIIGHAQKMDDKDIRLQRQWQQNSQTYKKNHVTMPLGDSRLLRKRGTTELRIRRDKSRQCECKILKRRELRRGRLEIQKGFPQGVHLSTDAWVQFFSWKLGNNHLDSLNVVVALAYSHIRLTVYNAYFHHLERLKTLVNSVETEYIIFVVPTKQAQTEFLSSHLTLREALQSLVLFPYPKKENKNYNQPNLHSKQ